MHAPVHPSNRASFLPESSWHVVCELEPTLQISSSRRERLHWQVRPRHQVLQPLPAQTSGSIRADRLRVPRQRRRSSRPEAAGSLTVRFSATVPASRHEVSQDRGQPNDSPPRGSRRPIRVLRLMIVNVGHATAAANWVKRSPGRGVARRQVTPMGRSPSCLT